MREQDDRFEDDRRLGVLGLGLEEAAIDLQRIEWQAAQIGQ